jgi:NADPH-dependent 2,4-dienoyl-CoA reductase/sulfur reductase-like enzyme
MDKTNSSTKLTTGILIIGGGPAGSVTAITARKHNPDKKITLIRQEKKSVIPCGIPYIFNRLDSVEKNIAPDKPLKANKIDLVIDEVVKIEPSNKKILLKKNKEMSYEKLVLATGSASALIPIKGIEKQGVWLVKKDFDYLEKMRSAVLKSKNIVIIGGGFIGVEIAEEISRIKGLNISVIEKLDFCLGTTLDEEFALAGQEKLKETGVKVYTKTGVAQIGGQAQVEYVKFDNGEQIPADLVILSIGARPKTDLAKEAGLKIGEKGGIWVDEYMRTNLADIFAVGDCAETREFFTGKFIPVMLASTAASEARIAGANLYQLKILRKNKGTLGAFSTFLNGLTLGAAGFGEKTAKAEGFDIVIGQSEAPNHHPGTLPDTEKIKVKLVFAKSSGALLGGQVMGPASVAEMINLLSLAIQQGVTLYDFDTLQISTHPLLTAAPTVYPLITAAQSVLRQSK